MLDRVGPALQASGDTDAVVGGVKRLLASGIGADLAAVARFIADETGFDGWSRDSSIGAAFGPAHGPDQAVRRSRPQGRLSRRR